MLRFSLSFAGWRDKFTSLAKKNRKIFLASKFKYLVVPCSTGVLAFKKYYNLPGIEIFELSEFLYKFYPDAAIDPAFAGNSPAPSPITTPATT